MVGSGKERLKRPRQASWSRRKLVIWREGFEAELTLLSGLLGLFFSGYVNKSKEMDSKDPTLESAERNGSEATCDEVKGTPGKQLVD